MHRSIMIVTGEASGDLHGAHLLQSLQEKDPDLHFFGMGGPELSRAGMEIVFDGAKVAVVGITEVIAHLPDILRAQRILRKCLRERKPDLLVIIDLPDFNIPLAGLAHKLNIPVFYYIPPQLWAWRSGRIEKLRKIVDKLGVILPFEEEYYRDKGVDACYVGHPLLDSVHLTKEAGRLRRELGINSNDKCVGIIPGSRKREVTQLLPRFLDGARAIQNQMKPNENIVFLLPKASTLSMEDLREGGIDTCREQIDLRILKEDRWDVMASCDAAIAASGTVTLELALLDVPMVVCYRIAPLTYRLAKYLIHLDNFSLVNLIAGSEIVPELLQDEVNSTTLSKHILPLLQVNSQERKKMKHGLAQVRQKLGESGASTRVAEAVLAQLSGGNRGNR